MQNLLHNIGLNELVNQKGHSIKNKINCVKQKFLQMDQESWRIKLLNEPRQAKMCLRGFATS